MNEYLWTEKSIASKLPRHKWQELQSGTCYSILIHLSKPSHIKWTKINKDREELKTVIKDTDRIKLLNSKP